MTAERRPTRRTIAIVAAATMLLLFAAVVTVGSSPSACARCHPSAAFALTESPHAATGCYECHAPGVERVGFKLDEMFGMYPASLVGRVPSGPVRETSREACLACHEAVMERTSSAEVSGLRISHASCAPDASCDVCHSTTAHGAEVRWKRGPVMERCVACHRTERADTACDTCHEGRVQTERLATGPWQVTHGPRWEKTHGMGDLDSCATCHPDDYCVRCHKVAVPHDITFGAAHGDFAIEDRASCLRCHRSERFCDTCHGTKMPHPAGFLRRHSSEAVEIENPACQRCHAVEDCDICHRRHIHPGNARISAELFAPGSGGGE